MGRPKKFVEPVDSMETLPSDIMSDASDTALEKQEDGLLSEAEVKALVEPHARLGVRVSFPSGTQWQLTMPFDDSRWFDRMQDQNLSKNIIHEETCWKVCGNMRNRPEDVIAGLEYLAMLKKNYRPFKDVKK